MFTAAGYIFGMAPDLASAQSAMTPTWAFISALRLLLVMASAIWWRRW